MSNTKRDDARALQCLLTQNISIQEPFSPQNLAPSFLSQFWGAIGKLCHFVYMKYNFWIRYVSIKNLH